MLIAKVSKEGVPQGKWHRAFQLIRFAVDRQHHPLRATGPRSLPPEPVVRHNNCAPESRDPVHSIAERQKTLAAWVIRASTESSLSYRSIWTRKDKRKVSIRARLESSLRT